MLNRFERILPQLEQVASIEQQWKDASFDPAGVARTQLNWMVMSRDPNRAGNARLAVSSMDEDVSTRFGLQPGYAAAMQPTGHRRTSSSSARGPIPTGMPSPKC